MRQPTRSTPKVFNAKYRPPKKFDWAAYRSLKPLLLLLGLFLAGFLITRLPFLQISSVELVGSTDPKLEESLNTLRGRSIFSRTISGQITTIKAQSLALEDLNCSKGIPATLKCRVVMREPVLVWKNSSGELLLDRHGVAYQAKTDQAGLPVIEDRVNSPIKIGSVIISEELVKQYQAFLLQMLERGFVVKQLFVTESFYQFGAIVSGRTTPEQPFTTNGELTVLLTTSYPIEAQIRTLSQLLQERSPVIKERIDLRVPGYLYYY